MSRTVFVKSFWRGLFSFYLVLSLSLTAQAVLAKPEKVLEIDGKIYPKDLMPSACSAMFEGAKCTEPGFGRFHVESTREGDVVHSVTTFSDPDGPQVIEESWEKNGKVMRARIENKALQKLNELEVRGDKVYYKTVTQEDGKPEVTESEDDAEENLVVPSTVMSYIRPQFDSIMNGKAARIRVAVLDRQEAFSFNMEKHREFTLPDGQKGVVLKMSPASIIVKAIVSPMYFYLKLSTGEMYAFEGRSALRRKIDGKYKEMDVRTAYEYKLNAFAGVSTKPATMVAKRAELKAAPAPRDPQRTLPKTALPVLPTCAEGTTLQAGQEPRCTVK